MSRIAIVMPVLGVGQATGRLVGWLKQVGDRVDRGDAVAQIETEKVTVDMEAQASGRIVDIIAAEGDEIAVGQPIAWLDDD